MKDVNQTKLSEGHLKLVVCGVACAYVITRFCFVQRSHGLYTVYCPWNCKNCTRACRACQTYPFGVEFIVELKIILPLSWIGYTWISVTILDYAPSNLLDVARCLVMYRRRAFRTDVGKSYLVVIFFGGRASQWIALLSWDFSVKHCIGILSTCAYSYEYFFHSQRILGRAAMNQMPCSNSRLTPWQSHA